MSDPACSSCPVGELEPAELISDGTCCRACTRFQGILLVLIVLNLVATVAFGVLGLVATAEPTSEPGGLNGGSESGGTTPAPSSPTDGGSGGCGNIFDPECSGTSGGIGG
ncbi:hypothetical protein AB0H23_32350 [Streptomyces albogriseolus]|uniref:hypothetical protein n=1 Tax=Streptomyces albogriseolus TaxID=1887 RepID=UPI003460A1C0